VQATHTEEELLAPLQAVAEAALPRLAFSARARLTLVHHRENAVFRVDGPEEAQPWALRVHRLGYRSPGEIRSELAWMEALRAAGVPTPPVRRGADGEALQLVTVPNLPEGRVVTALAWVNGTPLHAEASSDAYALLGRTSAAIQQHGRGWQPPPWFCRPSWDFERLVGPRSLWGDYAELTALGDAERALMDRAAEAVRVELEAFGCAPDRFGLTHADLMPDNVLVENGTPYVIDFDDCGYGWYLYDLATLLAMLSGDPDRGRVRDAWVRGYRAVAPLPDEHLDVLEALVMARMLLGLGWMHSRRETPLARLATGLVVEAACEYAQRFLAKEDA
jgi:Ser/Thr protein kinase RdoA (MazF antagonist)